MRRQVPPRHGCHGSARRPGRHDAEFREGAVRFVTETGKPIAEVPRDLGVKEAALGS
ncbi:transposase [Streptomyces sp. NPDC059866]|uniref:transposase n=1 Tax=Streptomyces sp. NPDC059866 TaxID=3346978 RepID=UPI003669E7D4